MACPACGASFPEGARFCPSCGHELGVRSEERRIATVLFADLVGFTALSEHRDPEQVKRLVDRCFERLVADVEAYGGLVDKVIGDALVALFGAPIAHEDDAERAVRAALCMQETLAAEASGLEADVRMRIGVNTGEVVVGTLVGGSYTAMGDVVNTANRLQTAAPPGGVLVGPATHAATRAVIGYREVGDFAAKGRDAPVPAWLAEGAILPPGYRQRRHTPLVGRDEELGMLQHAVNAAVERGRAHLTLLVGEAGVGKTRLAEELARAAETTHGAVVLEGRCVPYGEANVWWPLAEAVRRAVGISVDTPPDDARVAIVDAVASVLEAPSGSREVERVMSGLVDLLGVEGVRREVDPQRARDEVFGAVVTFVEAVAVHQPVVLVLSDLHWADQVVLEMIDLLVSRLGRRPLVLVATARQELAQRWSAPAGRHNQLIVNLDPLDREASSVLLDLLVEDDLPSEIQDLLLDRAGGNPFFLEELVALAAGTGYRHDVTDLPDTLRGLVAARLDALEVPERRVLDDAAVWGRSGPVEVLDRMAVADGRTEVATEIRALVDKEILRVEADHWHFRSDLVRDVAYGTLTKAHRAAVHHDIAVHLATWAGSPARAEARVVDIVAHHYATAAMLAGELGAVGGIPRDVGEVALAWVEEAASRAQESQVLPVSFRLFDQALALLGPGPGVRRADLLLRRAQALADARRLDEAHRDLAVAEAMCTDLGHRAGSARATLVRGLVLQHEGRPAHAVELLSSAARSLREVEDPRGEAEAWRAVGLAQIFRGDHTGAETAISEALRLSQELDDRRAEAWALQQMAWLAFVRGRADEAETRLAAAAETFEALGDPGGLAWVNGLRAFVRFQQGELDEARILADQILEEARRIGDRWAEGMMLVLAAGVRLWSGAATEALPRAEEALGHFREIGDWFGELQALGVLGRTLVMVGRIAEGFEVLEAARAVPVGLADDRIAQSSRTVAAGAAVQIGAPDRALEVLGEVEVEALDPRAVIDVDRVVALGLARLQHGEVERAVQVLENAMVPVGSAEPGPYAGSALALAYAAQGRTDEVLDLQRRVNATARATYLDRGTAALAGALVRARAHEGEAGSRFEAIVRGADACDDRVAQAVSRLTQAEGLTALGDPRAAGVRAEAEERLEELGIEASGWRRVIRLVLEARRSADPRLV